MSAQKTATVRVTRLMCGRSCGADGIACFQVVRDETGAREHDPVVLHGLDLERVLLRPLWDGAVVEVTVKLVRQGTHRQNPWRRK